jgi:hypothetical protein
MTGARRSAWCARRNAGEVSSIEALFWLVACRDALCVPCSYILRFGSPELAFYPGSGRTGCLLLLLLCCCCWCWCLVQSTLCAGVSCDSLARSAAGHYRTARRAVRPGESIGARASAGFPGRGRDPVSEPQGVPIFVRALTLRGQGDRLLKWIRRFHRNPTRCLSMEAMILPSHAPTISVSVMQHGQDMQQRTERVVAEHPVVVRH